MPNPVKNKLLDPATMVLGLLIGILSLAVRMAIIEYELSPERAVQFSIYGYECILDIISVILYPYDRIEYLGAMSERLVFIVAAVLILILILMSVMSLTGLRTFKKPAWMACFWVASFLLVLWLLIAPTIVALLQKYDLHFLYQNVYFSLGTYRAINYDTGVYLMIMAGIIWLLPGAVKGFNLIFKRTQAAQ